MKNVHEMPFGAAPLVGGGVRFRLWAPGAAEIRLRLDDSAPLAMSPAESGWHELDVPQARAGTRYRFGLPDGSFVPDPASRANPDGVDGPSVVVDAGAYAWQDGAWCGRPWSEAVVYELHVGTFTADGTFAAAVERLPELAALGVTAIELMPVAQFSGRRGWGYDGVLAFAPHAAYGAPDDLRRLVDAAHAHGLMVLLDVVYNHFGPDGNHLHAYCPEFFNEARRTPWGAAINFDGEHSAAVRAFFVHNALYWAEEFHVDGLRMDAVHAIHDDSPQHLCEEIAIALRACGAGARPPRPVHLLLENERNAAWLLERDGHGRPVAADAQWNDDLHHAAHVLATGETDGYYADYAQAPLTRLGRALAEGFVYQGEHSALRGAPHGEPSAHLPAPSFVSFLQNHDHVGNRALGERLGQLVDVRGSRRLEALRAAILLAPGVPMLFMGEEWNASTPFLYFCDFRGELADAVREGRRKEFARFAAFADEKSRLAIPDPNARATFGACILRQDERRLPAHAAALRATGELLALRRRHLVPRLARGTLGGTFSDDGSLLQVHWVLGDGTLWHLALNLGDRAAPLPL
ncbi:MAG: malto-oligosyltrehalose trehalohydrolase, partial [Burkholderiaceae bacterium]